MTTDFYRNVKKRLPKRGRPLNGERVHTTRFSLTVPNHEAEQLNKVAAIAGVSRHALASALVLYGVQRIMEEVREHGAFRLVE